MEIKDGKTGSPEAKPHGSPGRKKEIREIKKPFREPAWGQPEEPGGGTKDSGIKNGVSGATPAGPRKGSMKNGPPGSQRLDREAQHVKRRRATLPHPLECSTIAAPGLSYRVRNGTGRLTRAMTTANLTATARKPKESKPACHRWRFGNRLADARQTPIVVSFSDHPNAYCRPGRSSTGKTRNQPQKNGWNVVSPSPVSTGRLHPSRGFHLRPIKHVFNMRATTVQDRTES